MTEFQSNGKLYLAVQVPTYRKYFIDKTNAVVGTNSNSDMPTCRQLAQLPEGQYTIIGLASEMSVGEWRGIVMELPDSHTYPSYEETGDRFTLYDNAWSAGQSLIRSLNMNPETTLIIEKR